MRTNPKFQTLEEAQGVKACNLIHEVAARQRAWSTIEPVTPSQVGFRRAVRNCQHMKLNRD